MIGRRLKIGIWRLNDSKSIRGKVIKKKGRTKPQKVKPAVGICTIALEYRIDDNTWEVSLSSFIRTTFGIGSAKTVVGVG